VYPRPDHQMDSTGGTEKSLADGFLLRKGPVIFDRKGAAGGLFEAKSLLDPVRAAQTAPRILIPIRQPEFLTPANFFRTSWWARLGTILSRYPSHLTLISSKYFRDFPVQPRRFAGKQLTFSVAFHAILFLLLPLVLRYLPFQSTQASIVPANEQQVLYYHLANPVHREKAPTILPRGLGAAPGTGAAPELPPVKGASASLAALFAMSHPRIPDNHHQTIVQPLSAPELKIKADLKLPNLILNTPKVPKAPLQFNPNSVKPLQHENREVTTVAPNLTPAKVQQPLTDALLATNDHPRLAVPVGAPPAPNLPSSANGTGGSAAAPEFEATGAPGQGLLILGTSPGSAADLIALPQGNRYGEFSIAPGGSGIGSPGGQPSGSPNGGSGGEVGAGNDSTGVGAGNSGGGGGNSGTAGMISIRGTGGNGESLGSLEPEQVASMVFAMPKITGPRHAALLVSAGPMGGGGLDVYGALHCGKIFTVFLPTAGKNWTLQFCESLAPGTAAPPSQLHSSVVHMEAPLAPPEADSRFDFKRTPLPPEKLHKYVILKGHIGEDGAVSDLKVFQGLSDQMDAAAKAAFAKWTFRPAMKAGKPVSVDILVGIPSDAPKAGATN
jgi:Gram-negative bacterial TonB protein C-terminal